MVGARVPLEWQQQISATALAAGRKEAEIVRDAIAQYLGKTDPGNIKGANALLARAMHPSAAPALLPSPRV